MIVRNISQRAIVLRDGSGATYTVPSYGDLTIDDVAMADSVFRRWLQYRVRDIVIVPSLGLSTSLPTSPSNGQEVIYQVDATNGIYWRLRYNAASASTYKWEFAGGPEAATYIATSQNLTANSTWTDLATTGPSFVVPRAGDYEIYVSTQFTSAASVYSINVGVAHAGGTPNIDLVSTNNVASASSWSISTRSSAATNSLLAAVPASTELRMRYWQSAAVTTAFASRKMYVKPIRVI